MADDDDVLFEGQDLQKYLHKIGYQDFEVASTSASHPMSRQDTIISSLSLKQSNVQVSKTFFDSASTWFSTHENSKIKSEDRSVLEKHIQQILESGLLFEDDVHFVKNIVSCSEIEDPIINETSKTNKVLSLVSSVQWLSSVWNEAVWPVTGTVLLYALWNWKKNRQNIENLAKQKQFLLVMRDMYTMFWKSMKLLQDNELILRGFTLAKTGSTVSRLENSELPCMIRKWDSSPGLSLALSKAFTVAINVMSDATQQLIRNCPLFGQLDNSSHYVSFLDENELGLLSNQDPYMKLAHLKRLHHVFIVTQSEFLRRLALCFCPELWQCQSMKQVKNVMKTVNNVMKISAQVHSELGKEYQIFHSYGICEKIQNRSSKLPIQKLDIFKTNNAQDALRSASLHFQVLLLSTRALEEKLEIQKSSGNENFDDVVAHLSSIIEELDVCRSCCEEGISQIKRLTAPPECTEPPKDTEKVSVETINTAKKDKIVLVGYTDLDPYVEDDIFEAEITDDVKYETTCTYDEDIIQKEKLQHEKAKQLSKMMMQELKSFLVLKAKNWKEREAKILKAKQLSPETTSVPTAESDSSYFANSATSTITTTMNEECSSPNITNEKIEQKINEIETHPVSSSEDLNRLCQGVHISEVSPSKPKVNSAHSSPCRKGSPQRKLISSQHAGSDSFLERYTVSPMSNTVSSRSQPACSRDPKHVFASETFRPLQKDLEFRVGLHLSNDALAKFQARNIGGYDTYSSTGEKSSSEESLEKDQ